MSRLDKNALGGDINGAIPALVDVANLRPWDRQLRETREAFKAFALYRDLGDTRSVSEVARQLGRSHKLTRRWSVRWKWVERAIAWDRELDREKQRGFRTEIERVSKKHAQAASSNLAVLMAPAIELGRRLNEKTLDLTKVPDATLVRLVQQSATPMRNLIEVERRSMGLPSLMAGLDGSPPPTAGTVAELLKDLFRETDEENNDDDDDDETSAPDQGPSEDRPRGDTSPVRLDRDGSEGGDNAQDGGGDSDGNADGRGT